LAVQSTGRAGTGDASFDTARERDIGDDTLRVDLHVRVRDGNCLATSVYRPKSDDVVPAVLSRTPYDRQHPVWAYDAAGVRAARHGYALVVQSVRGRYESTGVHYPLLNDRTDAYDTLDWIVAEPWCNGSVGLLGTSYLGMTAWLGAASGHPAVKAAAIGNAGPVFDGMRYFARGVPQLDSCLVWPVNQLLAHQADRDGRPVADGDLLAIMDQRMLDVVFELRRVSPDDEVRRAELLGELPELTARQVAAAERLLGRPPAEAMSLLASYFPWLGDFALHPDPEDPFWESLDYAGEVGTVDLPVLHMGGWHDVFIRGTLKVFAAMGGALNKSPQRVIISPFTHLGSHSPVGVWQPPVAAVPDDLNSMGETAAPSEGPVTTWLERFVKGVSNGAETEAPVVLYVQRADRWRHEWQWPLPQTRWTRLYLDSRRGANSVSGDGILGENPPLGSAADHFRYDPADPAPSCGGTFLYGVRNAGVADQAVAEARADVLVYTGQRLADGLEVTGPVTADLWAATSAVDTDFTARLVDVFADGTAFNVCEGVTRLQFRAGQPGLVEPGSPQRVVIELAPTSYWFAPGHAIRLHISSSSFPLMAPNPNTGINAFAADARPVPAEQTVFHSRDRASCLVLPVIPE